MADLPLAAAEEKRCGGLHTCRMRISHRAATRLLVGTLVLLAGALPLIIGVTLGTGAIFHAIPFSAVGMVLAFAAYVIYQVRNRVDNPAPVDRERLLVEEMYDRVLDESFLFQLAFPSTTVLAHRTIVNGPFPLEECSDVLGHWFDSGWLDLLWSEHPKKWLDGVAASDWESRVVSKAECDYGALTHDDARRLLRDPSRWTEGSRDGRVTLAFSDEGAGHPWQAWIAEGESLRSK